MGDEKVCHTLLIPFPEHHLHDAGPDACIQHGYRFIRHHELRLHNQRACNGGTLPLSAGQFKGPAVHIVIRRRESCAFQSLLYAFFALFTGRDQAVHIKRLSHDIRNILTGIQGLVRVLVNHLGFFAEFRQIFSFCHLLSVEENAAVADRYQLENRLAGGGFSGAGFTDQRQYFPAVDGKADTVHCLQYLGFSEEGFRKSLLHLEIYF